MNSTLNGYAVVLRRWWRVVVAVPLLSLTIAALLMIVWPPPYQSTAVLFVSTPRDDAQTSYQGDLYSRERLDTYLALSKSPDLAQRVIGDVGLDIDVRKLIKGTKLTAVPDTVLIQLKTTGDTPQKAQAIGIAYVEELSRSVAALESVVGGLTPRAELVSVQPPTLGIPARRFPPWQILCGAAGAGLILGALAAVAISLLDGRIRRPEDAAEATGTPVLARFAALVPWEKPEVQAWASESARALRSPLDRLSILGSNVVMVASAERGAGKTGVALAVARALADRGSSVALVDFHSRGSRLARALELRNAPSVRGLTADNEGQTTGQPSGVGRHHQPSVSVAKLPSANWNGVSIIPFGTPEDNPGSTADSPNTAELFEALRRRYDWVVIDTPAAVDFSDASRLARHSDAIVLIAKAGRTVFDQLRKASVDLTRAGGHVAGVVFIGESIPGGPQGSRFNTTGSVQKSEDSSSPAADFSHST